MSQTNKQTTVSTIRRIPDKLKLPSSTPRKRLKELKTVLASRPKPTKAMRKQVRKFSQKVNIQVENMVLSCSAARYLPKFNVYFNSDYISQDFIKDYLANKIKFMNPTYTVEDLGILENRLLKLYNQTSNMSLKQSGREKVMTQLVSGLLKLGVNPIQLEQVAKINLATLYKILQCQPGEIIGKLLSQKKSLQQGNAVATLSYEQEKLIQGSYILCPLMNSTGFVPLRAKICLICRMLGNCYPERLIYDSLCGLNSILSQEDKSQTVKYHKTNDFNRTDIITPSKIGNIYFGVGLNGSGEMVFKLGKQEFSKEKIKSEIETTRFRAIKKSAGLLEWVNLLDNRTALRVFGSKANIMKISPQVALFLETVCRSRFGFYRMTLPLELSGFTEFMRSSTPAEEVLNYLAEVFQFINTQFNFDGIIEIPKKLFRLVEKNTLEQIDLTLLDLKPEIYLELNREKDLIWQINKNSVGFLKSCKSIMYSPDIKRPKCDSLFTLDINEANHFTSHLLKNESNSLNLNQSLNVEGELLGIKTTSLSSSNEEIHVTECDGILCYPITNIALAKNFVDFSEACLEVRTLELAFSSYSWRSSQIKSKPVFKKPILSLHAITLLQAIRLINLMDLKINNLTLPIQKGLSLGPLKYFVVNPSDNVSVFDQTKRLIKLQRLFPKLKIELVSPTAAFPNPLEPDLQIASEMVINGTSDLSEMFPWELTNNDRLVLNDLNQRLVDQAPLLGVERTSSQAILDALVLEPTVNAPQVSNLDVALQEFNQGLASQVNIPNSPFEAVLPSSSEKELDQRMEDLREAHLKYRIDKLINGPASEINISGNSLGSSGLEKTMQQRMEDLREADLNYRLERLKISEPVSKNQIPPLASANFRKLPKLPSFGEFDSLALIKTFFNFIELKLKEFFSALPLVLILNSVSAAWVFVTIEMIYLELNTIQLDLNSQQDRFIILILLLSLFYNVSLLIYYVLYQEFKENIFFKKTLAALGWLLLLFSSVYAIEQNSFRIFIGSLIANISLFTLAKEFIRCLYKKGTFNIRRLKIRLWWVKKKKQKVYEFMYKYCGVPIMKHLVMPIKIIIVGPIYIKIINPYIDLRNEIRRKENFWFRKMWYSKKNFWLREVWRKIKRANNTVKKENQPKRNWPNGIKQKPNFPFYITGSKELNRWLDELWKKIKKANISNKN